LQSVLLFGGSDAHNGDYSRLRNASRKAKRLSRWSSLKDVRKGDEVWFYIQAPISSIVARGIAYADAVPGENDDWAYLTRVKDLQWIEPHITLATLRTLFPDWDWVKKARAKVHLTKDRADTLRRIIAKAQSGSSIQTTDKVRFNFEPGSSKKVTNATAMLVKREIEVNLRHNLLQKVLCRRLASKHGKDNVRTEQPSGVGTQIDIVVKMKNVYWFYEIKTAPTARECLREAIGQILEYGFWPGAQDPARFVVVGEAPIDADTQEYLRRLKKRFSLPIEYEMIAV
jgi:hypothetical protein